MPPLVAMHMGMFIAATRFGEPVGGAQFVKLDESWPRPLMYQSWSERELKRHVVCVQFFPTYILCASKATGGKFRDIARRNTQHNIVSVFKVKHLFNTC
jgi:hypothetical protein